MKTLTLPKTKQLTCSCWCCYCHWYKLSSIVYLKPSWLLYQDAIVTMQTIMIPLICLAEWSSSHKPRLHLVSECMALSLWLFGSINTILITMYEWYPWVSDNSMIICYAKGHVALEFKICSVLVFDACFTPLCFRILVFDVSCVKRNTLTSAGRWRNT